MRWRSPPIPLPPGLFSHFFLIGFRGRPLARPEEVLSRTFLSYHFSNFPKNPNLEYRLGLCPLRPSSGPIPPQMALSSREIYFTKKIVMAKNFLHSLAFAKVKKILIKTIFCVYFIYSPQPFLSIPQRFPGV